MTPSYRDDRYEPLPGVLELPGVLIRKLGPRGRRALALVALLALAGLIAGAIVLVPEIDRTKRENAERERRETAERREAQRRRLIAESRPQRGRSRVARAASLPARRAVVGDLEAAILADARRRVRSGKLKPPPAIRTECTVLRYTPDPLKRLTRRRGRYLCVAVTSDLPEAAAYAGVVGHPFRAQVVFGSGRFTWCKWAGRPGEGAYRSRAPVQLPRACGRG
ncbi:MAG TPA: hypothetical protein VEQ61_05575 [Thermoleophilaceae bacterium]|nr:hypothetical protein [Thermoleophilaceae bacterium]